MSKGESKRTRKQMRVAAERARAAAAKREIVEDEGEAFFNPAYNDLALWSREMNKRGWLMDLLKDIDKHLGEYSELLRSPAAASFNQDEMLVHKVAGLRYSIAELLPWLADSRSLAFAALSDLRRKAAGFWSFDNGDETAAQILQDVAWSALEDLLAAAEKQPGVLTLGPRPVPVMLPQGAAEQWQAEAVRQARLQGVELTACEENANLPSKPCDEEVLSWALELEKWRGPVEVLPCGLEIHHFGNNLSRQEVIWKILDKGWTPKDRDGVEHFSWRGWRGAAWFLPPPEKLRAREWWRVCLAMLKERHGPHWRVSDYILNTFWSEGGKRKPVKDGGAEVAKEIQRRFLEHAIPKLAEMGDGK